MSVLTYMDFAYTHTRYESISQNKPKAPFNWCWWELFASFFTCILRYDFKHLHRSYFFLPFPASLILRCFIQTPELRFCEWFCLCNVLDLSLYCVYFSSDERFLSNTAQVVVMLVVIQPWCLNCSEISLGKKQHKLAWSWYSGLLFTPDWTGTVGEDFDWEREILGQNPTVRCGLQKG